MVVGIGVDCEGIGRMERSLSRPGFLQRVFSMEEQKLIMARKGRRRVEAATSCFAAKEAFLKATGQGLGGFVLADIAALRKESGAPYYELNGPPRAFCEENGLTVHLSITHGGGLAIAVAVLEKRE
ncbi:MAG: holo-ACP synthase [Oscillospiraceae bacterium]